jgi:hypothetical protein
MTRVGSQEVAIQTLRDEARDYIRGDSRDSSPRSFREEAAARTRGFIRACPGWILDLRGRSNLPSRHASVGPGDSQGEGSCIRTTIPTMTQEEREKS